MIKTPMRILMERELRNFAKGIHNKRILEIGSSISYEDYFKSCVFLKTDVEKRGNLNTFADVTNLPYHDNSFDIVICLNVLEHVEDPKKAISEMNRMLGLGGSLVLYTPFFYPLHDKKDYWRFTEDSYKLMLKDLRIIKIKKVGLWKVPFGFFVIAEK